MEKGESQTTMMQFYMIELEEKIYNFRCLYGRPPSKILLTRAVWEDLIRECTQGVNLASSSTVQAPKFYDIPVEIDDLTLPI